MDINQSWNFLFKFFINWPRLRYKYNKSNLYREDNVRCTKKVPVDTPRSALDKSLCEVLLKVLRMKTGVSQNVEDNIRCTKKVLVDTPRSALDKSLCDVLSKYRFRVRSTSEKPTVGCGVRSHSQRSSCASITRQLQRKEDACRVTEGQLHKMFSQI